MTFTCQNIDKHFWGKKYIYSPSCPNTSLDHLDSLITIRFWQIQSKLTFIPLKEISSLTKRVWVLFVTQTTQIYIKNFMRLKYNDRRKLPLNITIWGVWHFWEISETISTHGTFKLGTCYLLQKIQTSKDLHKTSTV